ncbi:hypothetical protein SAMN04487846_2016 [Microbacterium sp. cf046]|uniref:hypothetical protein n=1 Tax=Microbacterium sp. cf046 TaxID=1761803 RepID=UPI0008E68563|nr:hypothetical protein [Microbacterium sp. cf046]SFS05713.1 hypothetical protein SAMN04487846_2016 [Microbacterium sp. cf046]
MSTPEQPATPALTRKQMRDIRNTGATPIVNGDSAPAEQPAGLEQAPEVAPEPAHEHDDAPPTPQPEVPPAVAAPLARAATPVAVHDLPGADASVDLGVSPLTRRQARQQERIRTASVPVITPEVAAAHAASVAAAAAAPSAASTSETVTEPSTSEVNLAELFGSDAVASVAQDEPHTADEVTVDTNTHDTDDAPEAAQETADSEEHRDHSWPDTSADDEDESERAVVHPRFGAELLAGEPAQADLPPSFDQLISRSATGSVGTGNALILSQTPAPPPLVAPVTATGEVLITGSFNLPEGLGSTGHAAGTADGKEVDAVLVDGELPAHSSPTPIAASAAISTVKNGGDLIKPPAPEKGGRLMLTLAITAGVLALALVGVLILAFVTGVF